MCSRAVTEPEARAAHGAITPAAPRDRQACRLACGPELLGRSLALQADFRDQQTRCERGGPAHLWPPGGHKLKAGEPASDLRRSGAATMQGL
ncbi:hypothetical protein PF008_g23079 [Phytophthora fragariae]|uniref:Uncharacterized protein n=1 Tax=Phytophthora fragariae TaxID=53985 RepID=A0A6G0QRV2_9STRA|nr:hypothetical protein PF008_g23079 [Phytophthora fragariae]